MSEALPFHPIGMGLWTRYEDEFGNQVPGLVTARLLRFRKQVRLDRLLIQPLPIRWAPVIGASLAHVTVSVHDRQTGEWRPVAEADLPPQPAVDGPPHVIDLAGLETDHLRVCADLEHPVPPSHGEQWANPHNVPYRALEKLECRGEVLASPNDEPPVADRLRLLEFAPQPPAGMELQVQPGRFVVLRSDHLQVGFSLLRPLLTHLGWDGAGGGRCSRNLLHHSASHGTPGANLTSGPFARDLRWDMDSLQWGGTVSVTGHRVSYRGLNVLPGLTVDAEFEVGAEGLRLRLAQHVRETMSLPEAAAWRFCWNPAAAATSTWADPVRSPGRTGEALLPALFMAPGLGTLSLAASGAAPLMMVESSRMGGFGTAAVLPGTERRETGDLLLRAGRHEVELKFRVGELPPATGGAETQGMPSGLRRYFASGLGFRPEHGGFSNNAYSVNCHLSQVFAADIACALQPPPVGPDPAELMRSTLTLAFQGGPGYGDSRELYQDSDPSLLISAAAVHRARPDVQWLRHLWPYTKQCLQRVLGNLDDQGLLLCRRLSGNTGEKHWSSNAWDVISFGHHDAYSNAQAYRALRGTVALARDAGDDETASACAAAADRLKQAYAPCFHNPKTGLIAGWRSRDGQLHDYIFPWINGLAVCFGLVEGEQARQTMERLEQYRQELGPQSFHLGMAANLLPVPYGDHAMPGNRADGRDFFGIYINGCLTPGLATWYLRALSLVGMTDLAEQACRELNEGFVRDFFMGGVGAADEFYTWEGLVTGYEGALVGIPHSLLAVARHLYPEAIPSPEWWPE